MKILEVVLAAVLLFCAYYAQAQKYDVIRKMVIEVEKDQEIIVPKSSGFQQQLSKHRFFRYLKALASKPRRHFPKTGATSRLTEFEWKNCASEASEIVNIKDLKVSPDPLKFPGNVSLQFAVEVKETVNTPLTVALILEKYESIFWLKVPCLDGVGSCTYDDICKQLQGETCPPTFQENKIPCKCPFAKGSYSLPLTTKYADVKSVPAGQYRVQINMTMGSRLVSCTKVNFNVA